MKIPFVSFEVMHDEIKDDILAKMKDVYEKNWFIGRNPETGQTASPKYIHKLQ